MWSLVASEPIWNRGPEPSEPLFHEPKAQRAQRGILMARGKHCRETIFAAQLSRNYPRRKGYFERGIQPSLRVERQFGRHFKRQFGRGYLRVKNCRETVESQFLPRGTEISRRTIWERNRNRQNRVFGNSNRNRNRDCLLIIQGLLKYRDSPFPRGTVGTENQDRSKRPMHEP